MTLHQLSTLARELSAELFHRNVYRWRAPLLAAEDLDGLALDADRTMIARRLTLRIEAAT